MRIQYAHTANRPGKSFHASLRYAHAFTRGHLHTRAPACMPARARARARVCARPRESIYAPISPKKGTVWPFLTQCGAREPKIRLVFVYFLLISFTFLPIAPFDRHN